MESTGLGMINNKLHLLEQRLAAENESNDRIRSGTASQSPQLAAVAGSGTTTMASSTANAIVMGAPAPMTMAGPAVTARQTPSLPSLESTPNRPRMVLPVTLRQQHAPETETDKKLKMIMKQTGILTIDGVQYATEVMDLKELGDLGNGTSGNVVEMQHIPSGTVIAVKQMRRTGNTEENKRILMDLDVVLKSDCKYIVRCLGCFVRDPDVWICMELMTMCFDKLLKISKRPVPENILGKVTVATVSALSYLKDVHNVIHRDVKPSNILIDERGIIKLCDFGISGRLVDSKAHTRSAGCAAYMAPERIDPKKPEYDIRADVWSLGITLVELATARSPYEGCLTDFEVLTKVLDSEPPSLPYADGYTFSHNFREFVTKCLTKDFQYRPKYPELLEQPFIKEYEKANIDVGYWFQQFKEAYGIRTHPRTKALTTPAVIAKHTPSVLATASPAAVGGGTTTTIIAGSSIGNHQKFNTKVMLANNSNGHNAVKPHQQQSTQLPRPITNYGERGRERGGGMLRTLCGTGGGSGSSSTASISPQSPPSQSYLYQRPATDQSMMAATAAAAAVHDELGRDMQNLLYRKSSSPFLGRRFHNGGSSAGASNGNNGHTKYNSGACESPTKKETSVFSSIGQSIIRNLTTSPFSQKKHTHPLPNCTNQIDPLWRMPTTQDCTLAFTGGDNFDAAPVMLTAKPSVMAIGTTTANLPIFNRKRYQTEAAIVNDQVTAQHQQHTLVSNNRTSSNTNSNSSDMNPQRVQGNQSPIVLQRFYHQQNQLREREIERLQQQQQQQPQQSQQRLQQQQAQFNSAKLSLDLMSPYVSSYLPSSTNNSAGGYGSYHGYSHPSTNYDRHIGLDTSGLISSGGAAPSSLSSQSTSSQSSSSTATQSSIYENNSYLQHDRSLLQQKKRSPPSPLPSRTLSGIGVGGNGSVSNSISSGSSNLQYQPLPQQFVPLHALRQSTTPPSPTPPAPQTLTTNMAPGNIMTSAFPLSSNHQAQPDMVSRNSSSNAINIGNNGSGNLVASKLAKSYGRRPLQATVTSHNGSVAATGVNTFSNRSTEYGGCKDEHGWFNTLAGAMKRQFASYVKLQLNSSTACTTTTATATSTSSSTAPAFPSGSSSSSGVPVSQTTESSPIAANSNSPYYHHHHHHPHQRYNTQTSSTEDTPLDFSGTPTNGNSYLRRYAATGGGGAHLFAGLDRRHRSPDPPPRYNRGQSPLLLRKNLLELSGQPTGSPLLNRRYVTASPPLPPPRRGSESVPGSPQHFRTRIHYTPEPQRRIYRTIDQ